MTVTCSWCVTLALVTAAVTLEVAGEVAGELVTPGTLLHHLTHGDTGLASPNPATSWQLAQLGLGDSLQKLLPGQLFYLWCQRLAGLDFLEADKAAGGSVEAAPVQARPEVSKLYVENTVDTIRRRLEARCQLHAQVEALTKGKLDTAAAVAEAKLPSRTVARLKSWQPLDWESYSQHEWTRHLTAAGLVHEDCFLYRAAVTRDTATMTALVSVSPAHPATPPLWCLCLMGGEEHLTQESSEVIRDLERELNISSGQLALSTTLHKLLLLTDVVLEASSSDSSKEGEKFMKSQVFLDAVRGRMRRLPLMFNSAQQMFQQR